MSDIIGPEDYELVKKGQDWLMRLICWFLPSFAKRPTTYRLPFMRLARICVPDFWDELTVGVRFETLKHEHVHVRQFAPWYGPWLILLLNFLLPLPVLFSGRWLIERRAYLVGIRDETLEVDECVDILWTQYAWCWPKPLMRRWFIKHLKEGT